MSASSEIHDRRREISRGMVGLFKEFVGRGPTDAHTYINDDVVVIILRDTLTLAEKSLAEGDRAALVREVRRGFQGAMRERAIQLVQQQTGHKVKAFLSDNSVFPDYAAEVFVLDRPLEESEDGSQVYEIPDGLD
ncbi:MAG: DUF2294 domain-containing protein [Solirubrobacterales bacterium]